MKYTIEVELRNVVPPMQFDGETDSEFDARYKQWEQDKDKSFWRAIIRDTDGKYFAMNSPLFNNSDNGYPELAGIISNIGIAAGQHQSSKKNEIANLPPIG